MQKIGKYFIFLANLPIYILMGTALLVIMLVKPRGSVALLQSFIK